jgi:hypothetical protein
VRWKKWYRQDFIFNDGDSMTVGVTAGKRRPGISGDKKWLYVTQVEHRKIDQSL